eukprot:COSAG02_NODE_20297_length_839_cov_0.862162_1_plen_128_part_00
MSRPCRNGGGCTIQPPHTLPRYTCQCLVGFGGNACEVEEDPCGSKPCQHDGRCVVPVPGEWLCRCAAGWGGADCARPHTACASTPCEHGGHCLELSVGTGRHQLAAFKCECMAGFTGRLCSFDINEC